jgi:hypothetical protein
MVRRFLTLGVLMTVMTAVPLTGRGGEQAAPQSAQATNPNFEKLKKLAGTWLVADKDGRPTDQVASVIKLSAGGSVIHETLFPGQPEEMVSVYTVDGGDLIMTHYCILGNQPRMKADPQSPPNQIVFRFSGGSNLDAKKDKHMHEAVLTIVDQNRIEVNGIGWENGGPAQDMCCGFKLVRKN